jgi:hypothetical protein
MKNLHSLDRYRRSDSEIKVYGTVGDASNGCFVVGRLAVVASTGDGWEHVSVSRSDRTPAWDEMEKIKRLFFEDRETVMQLHVPVVEHVNCFPHCLHLWRPTDREIPRPPAIMV